MTTPTWKNGRPMTPRELKKRRGFFEHLRRQQARQIGAEPKWNIAVDGAEEVVMLDHVGPDDEEQPAD
jgi:hypothetical protein